MAVLVGIQKHDGTWETHVLTRFPHHSHLSGYEDVLGRSVGPYCYVEAYDGVLRHEAERLANQLNGVPRSRRREAFLDHADGLRLMCRGGTLK